MSYSFCQSFLISLLLYSGVLQAQFWDQHDLLSFKILEYFYCLSVCLFVLLLFCMAKEKNQHDFQPALSSLDNLMQFYGFKFQSPVLNTPLKYRQGNPTAHLASPLGCPVDISYWLYLQVSWWSVPLPQSCSNSTLPCLSSIQSKNLESSLISPWLMPHIQHTRKCCWISL